MLILFLLAQPYTECNRSRIQGSAPPLATEWAFAAAVSAAEWFFIAAYQSRPVRRGLSAAMKKDILLRVLCASSEAGGDVLLTHLPA